MHACPCAGTSTTEADEDGDNKMLSQSLMETLKTMENKSSSSDEDSDEQNTIMFEKTASSAGSEWGRAVWVGEGVGLGALGWERKERTGPSTSPKMTPRHI